MRLAALCFATLACADQSLLAPAEWNALRNEISGDRAWHWTNRIAGFDRNIGSEGYLNALRYVESELKRVGVADTRVVELPREEPNWTGVSGELWLTEPVERKIGSLADAGTAVAINSRSADVTAPVVDLGNGDQESDYASSPVAGKIVLACGRLDRAFRLAVFRHGAAGVITCAPRWPGPAFDFPDHIGWQTIPSRGENGREPTWAFSVSLHTAEDIREMLRAGRPVIARLKIESRIQTPGRMQILIATIRGQGAPNEAIVYTAHLDHQRGGANDDASGCANLIEIARVFQKLIGEGKIRRPRRDVQLWFAPEVEGEYAFFARYPDERSRILININQEMVGEDQTKLGSAAIFERAPWSRPTFLNDVLRHFVEHVFDTNVGTINQWERFSDPIYAAGGSRDHFFAFLTPFYPTSDHEAFVYGPIGIPAVHFTSFPDYNLHTNRDTIYNVDATQLRRFALIAAATGYFTAAADQSVAPRLINEVTAGSLALLARMSGIAGRLLETREPELDTAFLTARQALRTTANYAAGCARAAGHFGAAKLAEASAARIEAHGRLLEAEIEGQYLARSGKANPPEERLSPEEAAAARRVPAYAATLAQIIERRRTAVTQGPRLSGPLAFEVDSLIDGRRSVLDIYRIVKAESLNGGSPLYGPASLDQVAARVQALLAAGAVTVQ